MRELRDILSARTYRAGSDRAAGVIDLPEAVDALIDDKAYRPKFRKLIREGHLNALVQLAELAPKLATRQPPSHWFARYTSKAKWAQTLQWLAKLAQVARTAAEVAKRIAITPNQMKPVFAAVWRLGAGVIRHAVTVQELAAKRQLRKPPLVLFCWLTRPGAVQST